MQPFKNSAFYVLLVLAEDGLTVHRFTHMRSQKKNTEVSSFTLRSINEKKIAENRILRILLKILYFPFPYRVILDIPHQFCQTRYDTAVINREQPERQLTAQELNSFFTHAVWKIVEKNKKLFVAQHKYSDADVLLVRNTLAETFLDNKNILRHKEDEITSENGKELRAGIIQTHMYRPIFAQFARLLPKRAHISCVLENGFATAYSLHKSDSHETLLFLTEKTKTNVFLVSATEVLHTGSFNFGTLSTYEACNNMLGIGMESYRSIMARYLENNLSPSAKKFIEKILAGELARLHKGIQSFKKEFHASHAYVDAGALNPFVALQKKFPAEVFKENSELSAIIDYALPAEQKTFSRNMIQRLFRWLLPNVIE